MSSDTNSEINNLMLRLTQIRKQENEFNTLTRTDSATVSEIKRSQASLKYEMGKFEEQFRGFLLNEGLPEQFHLLEVVSFFWNKSKKTLVLHS
jgi:hypothetical protein